MQVIISFTLVPLNPGASISPYIAACQKVLEKSGLHYELHANGTNIEGSWNKVFNAVKSCHDIVHSMGQERIFSTLQVSTRLDKDQKMRDKVKSVLDLLEDNEQQD